MIYILLVLLFDIMVIDKLILYQDNDCLTHTMLYIILSITVPFIYVVIILYRKWKLVKDIYIIINYLLCIWGILEYFTIRHCNEADILYSIVIVLFTYQTIIWIIHIIWLIREINNFKEEYIIFDEEQSIV
jgi:hypothetical protein